MQSIALFISILYIFAVDTLWAQSIVISDETHAYPIIHWLSIADEATPPTGTSFITTGVPLFHQASAFETATKFNFKKTMQWARFVVENPSGAPLKLCLVGQFSVAEMWLIEESQPLLLHKTGYLLGHDVDHISMFPVLNLTALPGKNVYYIGANPHGHPFYAPLLALYAPAHLEAHEKNHVIFLAAAFGAFLMIVLLNNFLAFALRQRNIIYPLLLSIAYVCFETIASSLCHSFPPWFAETWVNFWPAFCSLMLIMMLITSKAFFGLSLNEHPLATKVIKYCIFISLLVPPFLHLLPLYLGPIFVAFNMLGYLLPLWIGVIQLLRRKARAGIFLLIYMPVVLIAVIIVSQIFGFIPFNEAFIDARIVLAICLAMMYSIGYCTVLGDVRLAHQSLRSGLKGIIADGQVDRLLQQGILLSNVPHEQKGTVVFIEIFGFSTAAIQHSPEKSFAALRGIIGKISAVIHKYDGIVDKSLGDGIICIFGHDVVGIGGPNHEERAVLSALELQRQNAIEMTSNPASVGQTVFPLRIGINTDTICIGNIGNADRFEIALSGNGVVLAKRFEEACEPHKIIVGRETFASLPAILKPSKAYYQRFVPIKHQATLEAIYEFDPFFEDSSIISRAREAYWNACGLAQEYSRIDVGSAVIVLYGEYGPMKILNFSISGLCVRSELFLGKGVLFDLNIKSIIGQDKLLKLIDPLKVEVMWGAPSSGEGFDLGVRLLGINDTQKARLLGALKRHLTALSIGEDMVADDLA